MSLPFHGRAAATAVPPPFRFRTRNLRAGENAAHTAEGARARGFGGSIVGGAIVYGRMVRPLLDCYGEPWLERGVLDLRFKAPAYDDDEVEARFEAATATGGGHGWRIGAWNDRGEELIAMTAELPAVVDTASPLASVASVDWEGEREQGTFDRMTVGRPFRSYAFTVSAQEQHEYCRATADEAPLYLEGDRPPAHPGLVMAQGSRVVANQFVMPFWIHAGSRLRHRRVIRVGETVELRCVPIEKWKRGGSEWVRFYQVYLTGGVPALEVWKTSVITVAQRSTP